jgi:hypothetical protein
MLPDPLAAMRLPREEEEPPGNYTRMFSAPTSTPAPAAPAPAKDQDREANPSSSLLTESDTYLQRLYRIDVPEPSAAPQPPASPEPAPFAGYGSAQPSEFTRIIESFAPPPAAAPAPAPAPAAAPPPAGKNSTKRYVIAAIILITLALGMIVVARVALNQGS